MTQPPPRPVRFGDLGVRVASGVVLAAVALVELWLGGWWLAVLAAAAAGLMLWELEAMLGGGPAPAMVALISAGALAVLVTHGFGLPAAALVILAGMLAATLLAPRERRVWLAAGLVYVGLAMCFLVMLRDGAGFGVVLWLVLVVIAADVGAYFVGRSLGGPKLWPAVSPGKTWSGALGGLGIAVLAGAVIALAAGWSVLGAALLSAALAVASQAGDLAESAVKRRFGVKDASRLIPGHGGLLDRLDGVMGALWLYALYVLAGGVGP